MMLRIALFSLLGLLPAKIRGIRAPFHLGARLTSRRNLDQFTQSKLHIRGGSTTILRNDDEEEEKDVVELDPEEEKKRIALEKWRMDQQMLMQLRSTFLTEALAKRGIPIVSITDVSTAEGDKPPEVVDWDCAMSTVDEPKVSVLI